MDINWNFSFGWLFAGILIFIAGGAVVFFYRQIAENFAHGVSSYDKVKLAGIIICALGIIVMTNLHTLILRLFVSAVFKR